MGEIELTPELLERAADMLRAVAHPVRIGIIGLLEGERALTVTEIQKQLKVGQSSASHHLRILKDRGVLQSRREGKNTFYSLRHERLRDIVTCINSCGRED